MHPTWSAAARATRPSALAVLLGVAACLAAAWWSWLCLSAHAASAAPEPGLVRRSVLTRPRPEDFREAADTHVLAAVGVLQDRSLSGSERLDAYAREAEAA